MRRFCKIVFVVLGSPGHFCLWKFKNLYWCFDALVWIYMCCNCSCCFFLCNSI